MIKPRLSTHEMSVYVYAREYVKRAYTYTYTYTYMVAPLRSTIKLTVNSSTCKSIHPPQDHRTPYYCCCSVETRE